MARNKVTRNLRRFVFGKWNSQSNFPYHGGVKGKHGEALTERMVSALETTWSEDRGAASGYFSGTLATIFGLIFSGHSKIPTRTEMAAPEMAHFYVEQTYGRSLTFFVAEKSEEIRHSVNEIGLLEAQKAAEILIRFAESALSVLPKRSNLHPDLDGVSRLVHGLYQSGGSLGYDGGRAAASGDPYYCLLFFDPLGARIFSVLCVMDL